MISTSKWLAIGLLASLSAYAQEFRATVSGRVSDSSGAVIAGVNVQAKNIGTNEVANATTDSSGTYIIPFLRPGDYVVTAEHPGFKKYSREGLTLQVGSSIAINIGLEVGAMTETVSVVGEAPLLDTEKADRGVVVDAQRVAELPLNARNPYILGAMMSGVNFRGAAIWQRPFDNGAIAEWSMNGGRQSNNEFLMDGAPNNAQMGGNNVAYVPIVDAVQEFKVQSNSYDAGFGKFAGGVMNVVLKSGTNDFHATGWEFLRRTPMDANAFQNKAVGAARAEHFLDQYGFQFEGPVVIPKLFNGRNKLFYLGSYEGYREGSPTPLFLSYAQPEMRTGDFSKLVDAQGRGISIYDPMTGVADATAPGGIRRQPFPGNRIPASMISPIASNIMKYMPAPNGSSAGQRYAANNLLFPGYFANDKFYNLILKFDYNLNDNNKMFFRHASNDRTEDRNDNGVFSGPGQSGQQPFQRINDAYVFDYVSTINNSTVLNIRLSNNRFIEKGWGRGNEGFDITSLGFPKGIIDQLPQPRYFGLYQFEGYTQLGRYQSINITNAYNAQGTLTKITGSHNMRFGLDVRRNHYIIQDTGNIWQFSFNRNWTQQTWNQADPLSGDGFASFLLGLPSSGGSNYPVFPLFRQWYVSPFFQDDWKVSRRLSVNLGFRWDINAPPDEKYNRLNSIFDTSAASPVASQINRAQFPQYANLKGGLTFAGVGGRPTKASSIDWNNFQPRLGARFQLTNKIVLGGGWGLFYNNPNNDYLQRNGFANSTPFVSSLDDGRTPRQLNMLANPYDAILKPTGASAGLNTFVGRNINWFNPEFKTPYTHQFNFSVQIQTTASSTLEVAYVGSRSKAQQDYLPINNPTAQFRKSCNPLEGGSVAFCNELVPNPFVGIEAFRGTGYFTQTTISRYNANRPYPQFTGDMRMLGTNLGYINYNSAQVNYTYRFKNGLNLLANYTLSKMVEDSGFNDEVALVRQRGLYFSDRPHFIKGTAVWELPFGPGRTIGGSTKGLLGKLIGGWQVASYYTQASGEPNDLPGNVLQLRDPLATKGGRWNGTTDWKAHQVTGWNTCVLRMFDDGTVQPQPFSLQQGCGTDTSAYAWLQLPNYAPRSTPFRSGQVRKQALFNIDASISKTTKIGERFRFQIGAEAFNLTNYYFYGRNNGLNTNPNDANFGTLFPHLASNQNGGPRYIQLRFKLFW